ncbi:phage/plasmid primase, P4 family, partial [Candidatus Bipolaricaulota bacterium]
LDGVTKSGTGQWTALCPAHDDSKPSLSISATGDKILLHCFAGCETEAVVQALGLNMRDLSLDQGKDKRGYLDIYDYCDEEGNLLYQVCRKDPKGFVQRQPGRGGEPVYSVKGVRQVPYRLPDLVQSDSSQPVFIVEGEKDVNRLMSDGLIATTNSGGAGKWKSEYSEFLRDRDVIVVPDNDQPGRQHAQSVAGSLEGIARSIGVVNLPGLPKGGDVSDWLNLGHQASELPDLAEPFEADSMSTTEQQYHLTDTGNAQRFADLHQSSARYCHPLSKWFIFDGTRWKEDSTQIVYQLVTDSVKDLWHEAGEATDSSDRREIGSWAKTSESALRIRATEQLARSQPGISVQPQVLDADKWKLNVFNGTVDLRTGQLLPHNREDLITKLAPISFDSKAECPKWTSFLARVLGNNEELCAYLQRAVGYALTGDVSEQVIFFLYGTGANGKSTFLETIRAMLGDYAKTTPFHTILVRNSSGPRSDIARLAGARFAVAQEAGMGQKLAEDVVKTITGGDTVTTRHLYKEYFEFTPQFKLFLAANHKPSIQGTDHAIWRRINLIPFTVRIPTEEQDKHLSEELRKELPGIFNWALRGCLAWQEQGLRPPEVVASATREYRNEMDTLGDFISEWCLESPVSTVSSRDLYRAYSEWSTGNGVPIVSQRQVGIALRERGFASKKIRGIAHWRGITLSGGGRGG